MMTVLCGTCRNELATGIPPLAFTSCPCGSTHIEAFWNPSPAH